MKGLLRNILLNAVALFVTAFLLEGVKVLGGIETYLIAGIILSLLFIIVKPILNILTLPLNMLSMGLFSVLINTALLYVLTILIPQVRIEPFIFHGASLFGISITRIAFNSFFAYIAASVVLSTTISFIKWIIRI